MANNTQVPQSQDPSSVNTQGDTNFTPDHINQEMYKKNAELIERNRTLSLLRKIDEVILSSVTNIQESAQEVTNILVKEANFEIASIIIIGPEKKNLVRLSISESERVLRSKHHELEKSAFTFYYPLTNDQSFIVQAVKQRIVKVTNHYYDVTFHTLTPEQAREIQESSGIVSFMVYPLIVRNQVIGAMTIGLGADEKQLSDYQRDLLDRLVDVVGIAIDNAILYNEVKFTNEKLEALDKLKDEFVSLASHELRTPMTAIKSYLWMALSGRGGPITEKQKYYLDRAYNSTDRLIKLVNDMLNISRIESSRLTMNIARVNLIQLIQEVMGEISPRAQELGITVTVGKPSSLPDVIADANKIKEVVINLIGNSLKFTPSGGVITISFVQDGDYIVTKITDTGAGIDPVDMPKLFQKFGLVQGSYTVNQTTSQGTGLGLYICKSIVQLHKGKIAAFSEGVGKGATFAFSLLVYQEERQQLFANVQRNANEKPVDLISTQI